MKKIIASILLLTILLINLFTINVYAAVLDDFSISVDKKLIHPNDNVVLTVTFGQPLGTFKIKVDFDDNIFEYVSAENGTGSVEGDTVTVEYTESTTTKDDAKITFKAKEGLTTSNPTDFTVTATNMKSQNGTTGYDDILEGKVETVNVEPIYQDYTIALEHEGDIIAGQETDFVLSYSSAMGRPYAKARLEGEVTKAPENATAKLTGLDIQEKAIYNVLDDGWGNSQGYPIGGEDVTQELNLKGIFSQAGEYEIKLRLINRANSDETIAEQTFNFIVKESEEATEELPEELPKTGYNQFIPIIIITILALITLVYINKKEKKM